MLGNPCTVTAGSPAERSKVSPMRAVHCALRTGHSACRHCRWSTTLEVSKSVRSTASNYFQTSKVATPFLLWLHTRPPRAVTMESSAQEDAPVDIHAPFTRVERMQQLADIDRVKNPLPSPAPTPTPPPRRLIHPRESRIQLLP